MLATVCADLLSECAGTCRDLRSDRGHCGTCGTACAAGQICADARCVLSCAGGATDCGGTCPDLASDRANCGSCGTVKELLLRRIEWKRRGITRIDRASPRLAECIDRAIQGERPEEFVDVWVTSALSLERLP